MIRFIKWLIRRYHAKLCAKGKHEDVLTSTPINEFQKLSFYECAYCHRERGHWVQFRSEREMMAAVVGRSR